MLPICSFQLKTKKRTIPSPSIGKKHLGAYLKQERSKRKLSQQALATQFNVTNVVLSGWERRGKEPHPKYLQQIIDFLGYYPEIDHYQRIGVRSKLYRMKHHVSLEDMAAKLHLDNEKLRYFEESRYCKTEAQTYQAIMQRLADLESC